MDKEEILKLVKKYFTEEWCEEEGHLRNWNKGTSQVPFFGL